MGCGWSSNEERDEPSPTPSPYSTPPRWATAGVVHDGRQDLPSCTATAYSTAGPRKQHKHGGQDSGDPGTTTSKRRPMSYQPTGRHITEEDCAMLTLTDRHCGDYVPTDAKEDEAAAEAERRRRPVDGAISRQPAVKRHYPFKRRGGQKNV